MSFSNSHVEFSSIHIQNPLFHKKTSSFQIFSPCILRFGNAQIINTTFTGSRKQPFTRVQEGRVLTFKTVNYLKNWEKPASYDRQDSLKTLPQS